MNIIAAVDSNWAIGYGNELLVRIPNDQKWFRSATTGKVVVMGHRTLATFPNGLPLKDRINVVLTKDEHLTIKDAICVNSIEELFNVVSAYDSDDVYVIGGASVYRQLLPHCRRAYITKIDYEYQADTYFPDLDEDAGWQIVDRSDEQTYFDLVYTFVTYERV